LDLSGCHTDIVGFSIPINIKTAFYLHLGFHSCKLVFGNKWKLNVLIRVRDSHNSGYEEVYLLGYNP
jgi:heme/copper-type cytochrome/quinol oxidase subunit 3